MSRLDPQLQEAAVASGFSDVSDSEFLEIEEPEEGHPEKPSCSTSQNVDSRGSDAAEKGALEKVKRKRVGTPLETFHLRYLCVTDLSAQVWCEQQMVYKRELPGLVLPEDTVALNMGKSIHLARELETHDLASVCTTSQEDSWAVKLLNLLVMIPALQAGQHVREFPVFGVLEGVFVVGVIDQLGYTAKGELELNELKTRSEAFMPSDAQKKRDCFQVLLYKYIFDAMVQGCLPLDSFAHHLHLRPEQLLGPAVQEQARKAGFTVSRFQDLLELTFLNLTLLDIPAIDRLQIEYVHQGTNALLGTEVLAYNRDEVRATVQNFLAYWKGQREAKGVDIEDVWKCRHCVYSSVCDWRMGRAENPNINREKKSRGK